MNIILNFISSSLAATAHEYYAVAGGRISMPCNITAPSSDDVVTLVLWYKGDMKVPIYTLDARKGPIEKSKHFPSKQLGRRVHFDLHVRNPGLTIDPVKGEDQGIYRCRVEYKSLIKRTRFEHFFHPIRAIFTLVAITTALNNFLKGMSMIDGILTSHCSATRGLLATDHVILNHGQVTWTTPELAPPLLTTTPHQREDYSALDRFNVHRCPTRRFFSGTGLEPVTKQATVRYLYHSATAATKGCQNVASNKSCLKFQPMGLFGALRHKQDGGFVKHIRYCA
ncbi:uncharacterized protein TNCV_4012961 [Trichonephila clavipes]|nr:uncharacterized protein TNCV_4012961 [Trichonephila clavipes]